MTSVSRQKILTSRLLCGEFRESFLKWETSLGEVYIRRECHWLWLFGQVFLFTHCEWYGLSQFFFFLRIISATGKNELPTAINVFLFYPFQDIATSVKAWRPFFFK